MAYTAWTVVFGEQPSAAKWNILGANDASFNDGTGIGTAVINSTSLKEAFFRGKYQSDTTNSTPTGLTAQFGWGQILGNATNNITETVTFPSAFTTINSVICIPIGAHTSAATAITSFTSNYGAVNVTLTTEDITTSSFLVNLVRSSGTFTNTVYFGYSWIAIGTV